MHTRKSTPTCDGDGSPEGRADQRDAGRADDKKRVIFSAALSLRDGFSFSLLLSCVALSRVSRRSRIRRASRRISSV